MLLFAAALNTPVEIISLVLACVLYLTIDIFLLLVLRKWIALAVNIVCQTGIILAGLYGLWLLFFALLVLFFVYCMGLVFTNLGELRWFFSAPGSKGNLPWKKSHSYAKADPKIFDRDAMYEKVKTAVLTLSRQKIGAIITFERKDDLSDICKNGTPVNAPVSAELLQTIFYPGTRLHDGAVVIRDDSIIAASVYYSPTNRPLTGKFGSRHRAAFGIAESTDSVTIVVSEETGRISIAYDGDLTSVNPDNFMRVFKEDMDRAEKVVKTGESHKEN